MRDRIIWKPVKLDTDKYGKRTVYIKHYAVPFVGLMAAPDTPFTVPAFIRLKGKRITGFVTPREHDALWFVAYSRFEV